MVKERLYTIINIGGLALGMAAALLIFLYLLFELSFDRYHKDHQQIYRVATDLTISGERNLIALNSVPMGPLLVSQLPEFTSYLRVFPGNFFFRNLVYRYADKSFSENSVFVVDSTFFDFFTCNFIHGSPDAALTNPFSLVMTRSMAERYFGDEPPLGKLVQVEGAGSFKVTAVIDDQPLKSHFQFAGLFSMSTMPHLNEALEAGFAKGATWKILERSFGSRIVWVYVKTSPGFDPDEFLQNRYYDFYQAHIGSLSETFDSKLLFQPMAEIHLKSKLAYEMISETGIVTLMSPELIGIFFIIAIFLLLLASINYTNIAISRFNRRSKEVGVKKVLGAQKSTLIMQFFLESVLITLVSLSLALLLVELATPFVNNLLNVKLGLNVSESPLLILIMLGVALFVGLIAGGYPAFYFSSFSPLKVLGYRFQAGKNTLTIKKSLIIIQFVVSVFMIIATMIVNRQLNFINNKELGYDPEKVIIIELKDHESKAAAEVLKERLLQSPHVENVAVTNYYPAILTYFNSLEVETIDAPLLISTNIVQATPDFQRFMKMEMAEGRFFSWGYQTDYEDAVVINEAAKRIFGWEEALGKKIHSSFVWADGTSCKDRRVIGVVKDFHYASLNKAIEPLVFYPMQNAGNYLAVRLADARPDEGVSVIQKAWLDFRPNYPLEKYFLEQVLASMYDSQRVLGIFFGAFAWLCIIIAFLGLYGLSAYSIEQRTREIGIRRVLGADFLSILRILGREFFWLIITAIVIAGFAAYFLMGRWLAGFAYHTKLSAWPFVFASVAAFFVAFLAIVFHAWRASRQNPAISLKYE